MRGAQDHDAILDGQCVQVVQHDMVGFRQQSGFALRVEKASVRKDIA